MHARLHEGLPLEDTGVVQEIARGEGVGAIEHDVVVGDDAARVGAGERGLPGVDRDLGIERLEAGARSGGLRGADARRIEEDLPLEVVQRDLIVIDEAEPAHAGGGEVEGGGGAESADADDADAGVTELGLPGRTDVREDEVARVAGRGRGHAARYRAVAAGWGRLPTTLSAAR